MRQLNTYHSGMAGYLMDFGFEGNARGTADARGTGQWHQLKLRV